MRGLGLLLFTSTSICIPLSMVLRFEVLGCVSFFKLGVGVAHVFWVWGFWFLVSVFLFLVSSFGFWETLRVSRLLSPLKRLVRVSPAERGRAALEGQR